MGKRHITICILLGATAAAVGWSGGFNQTPLDTTLDDYFVPGSQPSTGVTYETFVRSVNCRNCHDTEAEIDIMIYSRWQGSAMAQAARDPFFFACLAVANQDAPFAGDLCIRCHTPGGWISGRSEPPDGSHLIGTDRDGVSCSVCHRMVDPVFTPGVSPQIDAAILANIEPLPQHPGSGGFVLDPEDRRRGPFDDIIAPGHAWITSPFHRSAAMCGTCHDVSNPLYVRQQNGSYAVSDDGLQHPTANKFDMFPIERTYSEWLNSTFATTGVDMGGRFGGNITVVSTCQDCHMPKSSGKGCRLQTAPFREDMPAHDFSGGNTIIQQMALNLYPNELYPNEDLNPAYMQDGAARAVDMLQRAGTLEIMQTGAYVDVRVINETGHKLPSGYPEGRRMWINVRQFDAQGAMIDEFGRYEGLTAELTTHDTKVYEAHMGLDAAASAATGLPPGESFHFILNNVILKDNRIPPRGFTNAAFAAVQAAPVAANYADGQYWDDTRFALAPGAMSVSVRLYYQTASREYVTFLRDANHTNDDGDVLYEQWELTGKSPPVQMAIDSMELVAFPTGDADDDGDVDLLDYSDMVDCVTGPTGGIDGPDCVAFDFDDDADVDLSDFQLFQVNFGL